MDLEINSLVFGNMPRSLSISVKVFYPSTVISTDGHSLEVQKALAENRLRRAGQRRGPVNTDWNLHGQGLGTLPHEVLLPVSEEQTGSVMGSAVWLQPPGSPPTFWHIPGTAAQPAPSAAPAPCPRAGRWDSPPARCIAQWHPWCPPLSERRRRPSLPAGAPSRPPRSWTFWGRAEASLWEAKRTRVHEVNTQRCRIRTWLLVMSVREQGDSVREQEDIIHRVD